MSRATRLAMIDRTDDRVSLVRQCRLVGISLVAAAPGAPKLMRRIDEQYLKTPTARARWRLASSKLCGGA